MKSAPLPEGSAAAAEAAAEGNEAAVDAAAEGSAAAADAAAEDSEAAADAAAAAAAAPPSPLSSRALQAAESLVRNSFVTNADERFHQRTVRVLVAARHPLVVATGVAAAAGARALLPPLPPSQLPVGRAALLLVAGLTAVGFAIGQTRNAALRKEVKKSVFDLVFHWKQQPTLPYRLTAEMVAQLEAAESLPLEERHARRAAVRAQLEGRWMLRDGEKWHEAYGVARFAVGGFALGVAVVAAKAAALGLLRTSARADVHVTA